MAAGCSPPRRLGIAEGCDGRGGQKYGSAAEGGAGSKHTHASGPLEASSPTGASSPVGAISFVDDAGASFPENSPLVGMPVLPGPSRWFSSPELAGRDEDASSPSRRRRRIGDVSPNHHEYAGFGAVPIPRICALSTLRSGFTSSDTRGYGHTMAAKLVCVFV
jgi:hypothetical protein